MAEAEHRLVPEGLMPQFYYSPAAFQAGQGSLPLAAILAPGCPEADAMGALAAGAQAAGQGIPTGVILTGDELLTLSGSLCQLQRQLPLAIIALEQAFPLGSIGQDTRGLAAFLRFPVREVWDEASLQQAAGEAKDLWRLTPGPWVWVWQEPVFPVAARQPQEGQPPIGGQRMGQGKERRGGGTQGILDMAAQLPEAPWQGRGSTGLVLAGSWQGLLAQVPREKTQAWKVQVIAHPYPLPEAPLLDFISGLATLLVVEGRAPVVLAQLEALVARSGLPLCLGTVPDNLYDTPESIPSWVEANIAAVGELPEIAPLADLGSFIGLPPG